MEQALIEDLCGLYNLVYHESISKYDLLMLFNKYFKKDSLTIHNFTDKVLDKSLVNNRSDFSFRVPSYENMIKEMREWIVSHRDLYPHYVFDQEH